MTRSAALPVRPLSARAHPSATSAMRILLITRSLELGGAERQLVLLAGGLHARGHAVGVATFYPGGPLEADLLHAGVPLFCFEKQGRWDTLGFTLRLGRHLRRTRPEILYGFLGTPNLFGLLAKPVCSAKIVWGIRASNIDLRERDRAAAAVQRTMRLTSRLADSIICNSHAGFAFAASEGFDQDRMTVIPNGIDTTRFRPDPLARARVRAEWGISDRDLAVGLIGRLDPMKDHTTFLHAAARASTMRRDLRFVCIGPGPQHLEHRLCALADDLGLGPRVIWAGGRTDMPAAHNALDMVVSSSAYGEGFGNVIGEAMATGTPCVVTNVGDSEWIVGSLGDVVPPRDPAALAEGVLRTAKRITRSSIDRDALRARIDDEFSVTVMISRTEAHFRTMLAGRARR